MAQAAKSHTAILCQHTRDFSVHILKDENIFSVVDISAPCTCALFIFLKLLAQENIQPVPKVAVTFAILREFKNIKGTTVKISEASKEVMHFNVYIYTHIFIYSRFNLHPNLASFSIYNVFISCAFAKHSHTIQVTQSSPSFLQITCSMCGEANTTSINPAHLICLGDTTFRMKWHKLLPRL